MLTSIDSSSVYKGGAARRRSTALAGELHEQELSK
jgi:hypothetical protein